MIKFYLKLATIFAILHVAYFNGAVDTTESSQINQQLNQQTGPTDDQIYEANNALDEAFPSMTKDRSIRKLYMNLENALEKKDAVNTVKYTKELKRILQKVTIDKEIEGIRIPDDNTEATKEMEVNLNAIKNEPNYEQKRKKLDAFMEQTSRKEWADRKLREKIASIEQKISQVPLNSEEHILWLKIKNIMESALKDRLESKEKTLRIYEETKLQTWIIQISNLDKNRNTSNTQNGRESDDSLANIIKELTNAINLLGRGGSVGGVGVGGAGSGRPGNSGTGSGRPGNSGTGSGRPGNTGAGSGRPGNSRPGNSRPGNSLQFDWCIFDIFGLFDDCE